MRHHAYRAVMVLGLCASTAWSGDNRPDVKSILKKFSDEPAVTEVQKAALEWSLLHPEETEGWILRSRLSGLLPKVEVGLDRALQRDESLDKQLYKEDRFGVDTDNDVGVSLKTTFELPRIVFDADEVRVRREEAYRAEQRISLLTMVTRVYYERRRLQVQMLLDPPSDPKLEADEKLKVEELDATLDALTGGFWSKRRSAGKKTQP